jgi:hypothetical protein
MKKITLVIAFLLAIVSQTHAQFSESFEAAALPASWTVINGGDANTWISIDLSTSTEISGHTGTHVAGIVYTTPTAHDDYLITPAITVAAGTNDRFSFWARSRDPLYPEQIDLLLSTTTANAAGLTTTLQAAIAPLSGANFYKYTYDLSDHVGETIYIGFHSTTADKFVFDIDDVVSDALPFCSEPNPISSNVTETGASLSWPAVAGSINYEYVLDTTAGDPAVSGTTTTALTFNPTLLANGTTYYFHIRNNCDTAGLSAWSTISFTTLTPFAGCLNAENFGQWPTATYTPATCNGIAVNTIVTNGYAAEYSKVNVTSGETYTFMSSVASDVITIGSEDGTTAYTYGTNPVVWVSTVTGVIRFYTHLNTDCGEEGVNRTRSIICGIAPCVQPIVTFAKVTNCPTASFNVTANITSLGSATSITVTDDQSSTPQTVTATGLVTFGPYANGTTVILTVTNDQSPVCTLNSAAMAQVECPPLNDNFANAIAISCGSNYTGITTYANLDEDNAPDGFGADMDAPNVWYTYTGTGTAQSVTLNLCGSGYDTSVLVYTGTSGALTLVAGNDDDATCGAFPASIRSRVTFDSDGTSTYYIAVEGYDPTSVGSFTMDVTCTSVTPPAVANQTCATALGVLVNNSDVISDNSFGDISPAQPTCDPFGSVQDVWFSFVATSATVDVMVTPGFMTSANYAIYSGACGALTSLACNSNLTASDTESLTTLTGGDTYYIQVWSNFVEQGTFTLRLNDPNLAVSNFDAANFRAYPNPVKGILNLSYDKTISNVSVFNLLGQEVITKTVNDNLSQIDMSQLAAGTYMVKVTADNEVKTIKVIKQ